MGLVFVSGRDRSPWWYQHALAIVRPGESIAFRDRALSRHNRVNQNAKSPLRLYHAFAARVHDHRHVLSWLSENLFRGSEARLPERSPVSLTTGSSTVRAGQGR